MTTYYVDPDNGSDYYPGNSWDTPFQTFQGFTQQNMYLLPGDLVKVAKSATKLVSSISTSANTITPSFSSDPYSQLVPQSLWRRHMGGATGNWVASQTFSSFISSINGVKFTADAGLLDTPSIKLCYKAVAASYINLSTFQSLLMQVRMYPAYTGPDTANLTPSIFEVKLCSDTVGDTPLLTISLDAWVLNSATAFTSFVYTYGASFPTNVNSISIWRSSATLSRGVSSWGVEFYKCTFFRGWSNAAPIGPMFATKMVNTAMVSPLSDSSRYPFGFTTLGNGLFETVGTSATTSDLEVSGVAVAYPLHLQSTTTTGAVTSVKGFIVPGINMVGQPQGNPATTQAIYDLWVTAGGVLSNPVVVEGGYDVVLDVVNGTTVFTGGWDRSIGGAPLIDLHGAPYVTVRNISALNGLSSVVVNPGTGYVQESSQFSDGVPPVHGLTSAIDCTFNTCISSKSGSQLLGTLGGLTLNNTVLALDDCTITSGTTVNCTSLNSTNSVLYHNLASSTDMLLNISGNAVVDGFVFCGGLSWKYVSTTSYGHNITYKNSYTETATTTTGRSLFRSTPSSAWKCIIYENCNFQFLGPWSDPSPPSQDEELVFKNCTTASSAGPSGYFTAYAGMMISYESSVVLPLITNQVLSYSPYLGGITIQPTYKAKKIFIKSELASGAAASDGGFAVVYDYALAGQTYQEGQSTFVTRFGENVVVGKGVFDSLSMGNQPWPIIGPWGEARFNQTFGASSGRLSGGLMPNPVNAGVSSNPSVMFLMTNSYTGSANDVDRTLTSPNKALDYFSKSFGPVMCCHVEGGKSYRLKCRVIPNVMHTIPRGDFNAFIPNVPFEFTLEPSDFSLEVNNNPQPMVAITALSTTCFPSGAEVMTGIVQEFPSDTTFFNWRDIEFVMNPTYSGEVSFFIAVFFVGQYNPQSYRVPVSLIDNLTIEMI